MRHRRARSLLCSFVVAGALAGGALVMTPPAWAAGVAPTKATAGQREQAQAHFLKGKDKYAKKQYDAALAEFTASLEIVASPNTRLYVGRCQRELGRLVAAYVEFQRTEAEAKELLPGDNRYEKAGASALEERTALEPQLGFLKVEIAHPAEGTKLTVAGDEIRPAGWTEPIPVMPGTAEVVVEPPDRPPIRRTVEIAATERKSLTIEAGEPAPAPVAETRPAAPAKAGEPPRLRNAAYVTAGVAVVGLGMFAFFGLKANSSYSDLQAACGNGPCPPGHESAISDGRTEQTVANIGLAVFVVGAAATATIWVLSAPKKTGGSGTAKATARLDVGPSFTGLRGAF